MKFTVVKSSQVTIASIKERLTMANSKVFSEQLMAEATKLSEGSKGLVIDFETMGDESENFFRVLTPIAKILKSQKMRLMMLHLPKGSQKFIKENGLDDLFHVILPSDEVLRQEKANAKLDVNFINPFIEGAIHTFKVQCNVELTSEKMFLKDRSAMMEVGIAGVIGLTSASFNGSISICFPKSTFLRIMEAMLGERYEEITSDLEDGAGELLNIIFGHAKRILNEKNYQIDKAIPTIVKGKELEVKHLSPEVSLVLPFKSEAGPLYIDICIQDK